MINKMDKANKKQLEKKMERIEKNLGKDLTTKEKDVIKKAVKMAFDQYGETLIRLGRT
jgi:cation transport regulator ChaB